MRFYQSTATAAVALVLASACGASTSVSDSADRPATAERLTPEKEAPASEGAPEEQTDAYKIVMLGDSLTAGFGLSQAEALPERLEQLLSTETRPVDLVNAGVSGDTSAGGLARYDWSVASAEPDLLIIALGANDYLTGIDPTQTRANLTAIIERARADQVDLLLVSISARSSSENDPRAAEFAQIYPDLSRMYEVPLYEGLVDPIFDQPDLLMPDGLHPTAEGVRVIAEPLALALSERLPKD